MKYIDWIEIYHDQLFELWKASGKKQTFSAFRRMKWSERKDNE